MSTIKRMGRHMSARPLKPWLINYIKNHDNNSELSANAVKIMQCVSGPDKQGDLIAQVTDGTTYIKSVITNQAIQSCMKKNDDEDDMPPWDKAIIILSRYFLKFEPHDLLDECEFVIIVDEFKLWDLQRGFDFKKDIYSCMSNQLVKLKLKDYWTHWRENEKTNDTFNSMTGSHMLSLLAEMGQMTQPEEDSCNVVDDADDTDSNVNAEKKTEVNTDTVENKKYETESTVSEDNNPPYYGATPFLEFAGKKDHEKVENLNNDDDFDQYCSEESLQLSYEHSSNDERDERDDKEQTSNKGNSLYSKTTNSSLNNCDEMRITSRNKSQSDTEVNYHHDNIFEMFHTETKNLNKTIGTGKSLKFDATGASANTNDKNPKTIKREYNLRADKSVTLNKSDKKSKRSATRSKRSKNSLETKNCSQNSSIALNSIPEIVPIDNTEPVASHSNATDVNGMTQQTLNDLQRTDGESPHLETSQTFTENNKHYLHIDSLQILQKLKDLHPINTKEFSEESKKLLLETDSPQSKKYPLLTPKKESGEDTNISSESCLTPNSVIYISLVDNESPDGVISYNALCVTDDSLPDNEDYPGTQAFTPQLAHCEDNLASTQPFSVDTDQLIDNKTEVVEDGRPVLFETQEFDCQPSQNNTVPYTDTTTIGPNFKARIPSNSKESENSSDCIIMDSQPREKNSDSASTRGPSDEIMFNSNNSSNSENQIKSDVSCYNISEFNSKSSGDSKDSRDSVPKSKKRQNDLSIDVFQSTQNATSVKGGPKFNLSPIKQSQDSLVFDTEYEEETRLKDLARVYRRSSRNTDKRDSSKLAGKNNSQSKRPKLASSVEKESPSELLLVQAAEAAEENWKKTKIQDKKSLQVPTNKTDRDSDILDSGSNASCSNDKSDKPECVSKSNKKLKTKSKHSITLVNLNKTKDESQNYFQIDKQSNESSSLPNSGKSDNDSSVVIVASGSSSSAESRYSQNVISFKPSPFKKIKHKPSEANKDDNSYKTANMELVNIDTDNVITRLENSTTAKDKTAKRASSPTISKDKTSKRASSPTISKDKTSKRVSSPTISKDKAAKRASSPTISKDKTSKQASSPTISIDKTAKRASSPTISKDKTSKRTSSSARRLFTNMTSSKNVANCDSVETKTNQGSHDIFDSDNISSDEEREEPPQTKIKSSKKKLSLKYVCDRTSSPSSSRQSGDKLNRPLRSGQQQCNSDQECSLDFKDKSLDIDIDGHLNKRKKTSENLHLSSEKSPSSQDTSHSKKPEIWKSLFDTTPTSDLQRHLLQFTLESHQLQQIHQYIMKD